ncbi:ABC transporter ATP-binding protein [Yoonia sp. 2307UL14-13]|uniref:ABC transporter ATP-binding protein n=1 Tax=Yoonia sp. 2307UL14-13 TaxID=3126506 RepID=UPI00309D626D
MNIATHIDQAGVAAPILSVDVSSLSYDGMPVLSDIRLSVNRGETIALVGPSGIGKTSLLRIIGGLERGCSGDCQVNGRVAMVFQEPTLLPWRSVLDNITITTGVSTAQADSALAEVGLSDRALIYPNRLSLGQQRRLSLARAFAIKPDLLLMDEPFVSLDPELVDEMMALFVGLRDAHEVATILVTHVEDEARRLADRVVRLEGSPATIVSAPQSPA